MAKQQHILLCILSVVFWQAYGLDVLMRSFDCEMDASVQATDLRFICDGGGGVCTFGENARVKAMLTYSGIQYARAYATVSLATITQTYTLFRAREWDLCNYGVITPVYYPSDDMEQCPNDGTYKALFDWQLPSLSEDFSSWLATGFSSRAIVHLYVNPDETNLLGYCELKLTTTVTPSESRFFYGPPSAALALGYLVAFGLIVAVLVITVRLRTNFQRRKKKTNKRDDVVHDFHKLHDKPHRTGALA